jgi:hypothetical protein
MITNEQYQAKIRVQIKRFIRACDSQSEDCALIIQDLCGIIDELPVKQNIYSEDEITELEFCGYNIQVFETNDSIGVSFEKKESLVSLYASTEIFKYNILKTNFTLTVEIIRSSK